MSNLLLAGEAAKLVGVSSVGLHRWDSLLQPERTESGVRLYRRDVLEAFRDARRQHTPPSRKGLSAGERHMARLSARETISKAVRAVQGRSIGEPAPVPQETGHDALRKMLGDLVGPDGKRGG